MQLIWSVSGLGISTVTIMSVVFILTEFSDAGWVSPMLGTICGILIPGTMANAIDRYGLVPSQSEEAYRLTYDEAVEQACQLALLDRINTVLNKETELEPMIRLFVEAIVETSGYTMVGLYLINGNVLEVQHCHGYEKEASLGHISTDTGVNGRVVRTEQGVRLEDVHADPDFISGVDGIISEICVPLKDNEGVIRTLCVDSMGDINLTKRDLSLIQAIGDQVSRAIGRARLYSSLSQQEENLRLTLDAVNLGIWIRNLETNELQMNERFCRIYAIASDSESEAFPFYRYSDD